MYKTVKYKIFDNTIDAINELKNLGYKIFNLEITNTSVSLRTVEFSNFKKIALIVGNENSGVSEEALKNNQSIHIDMYGNNSSMNVSTSLAIATYKISEDLRKN